MKLRVIKIKKKFKKKKSLKIVFFGGLVITANYGEVFLADQKVAKKKTKSTSRLLLRVVIQVEKERIKI